MTDKVTLTSIANLQNETTAVNAINNNNTAITVAMNNTLSRDGTVPNQMNATLDMNTNQIINLPSPATLNSPARLRDVTLNPTITVPTVGTSGGTVPLLNGTNTWSGVNTFSNTSVFTGAITSDFLMKSGRPWADVRAYGALGDGVTDDTAAFAATISHMSSVHGGGIVFIPPGNYVLKTGITIPNYIRLVGAAQNSCIISDGGNNTNATVTITGHRAHIENLTVEGCGRAGTNDPFPNFPAIDIVNNNQDGVRLLDCTVLFGNPTLRVNSQDVVIDNCSFQLSYAASLIEIDAVGQIWAQRCILDQSWPVLVPTSLSPTPTAWVANTVYAVGTVVSVGTQYIQCLSTTSDAKSGSVAPTVGNYTNVITDNHVTWLLVCNTGYACVNMIGSGENYFHQCDISGSYVYGFHVQSSTNMVLGINNCIIGQVITAGVRVSTAQPVEIMINNSQVNGGWSSGYGVLVTSSYVGNLTIQGNVLGNCAVGIGLQGSGSTIINGNQIGGCSGNGVAVSANVNNFIVSNNVMGSPGTLGANTNAITIAPGTSNYYNIVNNIVHGAGTGVVDNGTGVNKTLTGNI